MLGNGFKTAADAVPAAADAANPMRARAAMVAHRKEFLLDCQEFAFGMKAVVGAGGRTRGRGTGAIT